MPAALAQPPSLLCVSCAVCRVSHRLARDEEPENCAPSADELERVAQGEGEHARKAAAAEVRQPAIAIAAVTPVVIHLDLRRGLRSGPRSREEPIAAERHHVEHD